MTTTIHTTANGTEYAITYSHGDVSVDRITLAGRRWVGSGTWNAAGQRIEDMTADLGNDVYAALDEALADALDDLLGA